MSLTEGGVGGVRSLTFTIIYMGGLKGNSKKKFIMEVKTRKSIEWRKNWSKSPPIWDQTVLSITQARNERLD